MFQGTCGQKRGASLHRQALLASSLYHWAPQTDVTLLKHHSTSPATALTILGYLSPNFTCGFQTLPPHPSYTLFNLRHMRRLSAYHSNSSCIRDTKAAIRHSRWNSAPSKFSSRYQFKINPASLRATASNLASDVQAISGALRPDTPAPRRDNPALGVVPVMVAQPSDEVSTDGHKEVEFPRYSLRNPQRETLSCRCQD